MKKRREGLSYTRIIVNVVIVASAVVALTSGFRLIGGG